MRHLLLPAAAIAVALWLSSSKSPLPSGDKIGAAVVIALIGFAAHVAMNRRAKARHAGNHTTPYTFRIPAKGRK